VRHRQQFSVTLFFSGLLLPAAHGLFGGFKEDVANRQPEGDGVDGVLGNRLANEAQQGE
jgi:hypothetical protein